MSKRYCNSFYLGGIQLVWHRMELSKGETNQTPLDVKPANQMKS